MERRPSKSTYLLSTKSTILFVHGFSAAKEGFLDTINFLDSSKYHIVSVDLPGHGMTSGETPEDAGIQYFTQELHKVSLQNNSFSPTQNLILYSLFCTLKQIFLIFITLSDSLSMPLVWDSKKE